MKKSLLVVLALCACKYSYSSQEKVSNLGLYIFRENRVSVTGTAVKGIIKNATVTVSAQNTDGSCGTGVIASGQTDSTGGYSLSFLRTGSFVCVTVSAESGGSTKLFDEKENTDIKIPANSTFKTVSILPEGRLIGSKGKSFLASPFSTLLTRRLQYLIRQGGSSADKTALYKRASKEVVIRFGLSTGLAVSGKAFTGMKAAVIYDKDYPELEDLAINLKNPSDSLTAKSLSVLAGISYLANKTKTGTQTSIDDIANVINALAADFEDGAFDGKATDGKPITIGTGASMITFSSSPLTSILLPAMVGYVQEGGKLSAGIQGSSGSSPSVSSVSAIEFADNIQIVSEFSSASLSYSANSYAFPQSIAITPVSPTVSGTVTSCTASPDLPSGLSLSSTTCTISGTPSVWQLPLNYTITAVTSKGTVSAKVSIAVTSNGAVWTARALPSSQAWSKVAFGNGVFVATAAGGSNIAATSTDGITWTARTMPSAANWGPIAFGNGVFVAIVGTASNIAAVSSDGINWISATMPSSGNWRSVAYGNGVFVAVVNGSNVAATSPDGINWTARTLSSASGWQSVVYGNGVFAVVSGPTSTAVSTSPDGITWTARTIANSNWNIVAYGNGVFSTVSSTSAAAATSPDGITWTSRTMPSASIWFGMAYGDGIFASVGFGSTAGATSTDGITWTARTLPVSDNWISVAYGNGVFVAISQGSAGALSSP